IKAGINSKADLFMVQMQDYLKLGEEARMNTPSTLDPKNWVWRMKKGANTKALSKRLYKLTKEAGRI
ncbi:MAG: 4-alpha-glucanotransferase, partial [Lachnospiraceae bacterium]|nr:4-alpha-glucanotransferase [Lachnospiraceae bacterium]